MNRHSPSNSLLRALAALCFLGAAGVFLLPPTILGPGGEGRFFGWAAFLATMLALPSLLFRSEGRWLRPLVLLGSLVTFGFLRWSCPRAVGALEESVLWLFHGGTDPNALAYLAKAGLILGATAIFGRYFCGFVCPLGTLQDLVHVPRLRLRLPRRLDGALKWGKYLTAALLILSPALFEYRLIRQVEPFKIVFRFGEGVRAPQPPQPQGEPATAGGLYQPISSLSSPAEYFAGVETERFSRDSAPRPSVTPWLLGFLVLVLGASVFLERPYCRYLSPVGGLLALVGRLAPGRIRVATHACTGCASCVKACPVDAISMVRTEGETCAKAVVNQAECIVCKECEARCPEGGLSYGGPCPRQVSRPEA